MSGWDRAAWAPASRPLPEFQRAVTDQLAQIGIRVRFEESSGDVQQMRSAGHLDGLFLQAFINLFGGKTGRWEEIPKPRPYVQ